MAERLGTKEEWQPREVCARCKRPARVCFCAHVPRIETETPVLLLQHPREEHVAIGTARMASLCLSNATLVVGTELDDDEVVVRALSNPERPPVLLWPGEGARDLATDPPEGPVTLVVVDGTWALAKKLVRINPRIGSLPRYALSPPSPSEYRIRAEPADSCVSTLEAVMHALGVLEGDPERFRPMMAPFRAMVDMQIDHEERLQGARLRARPRTPKPRRLPPALRLPTSLVVIAGEANAWPYRPPSRHADELVQWAAHRLDTGETFEAILAPRNPLSPATPLHTRLSSEALAAGSSVESFLASWRAFVREDDVIAGWGHYGINLLRELGGAIPSYVDLRGAAVQWLRGKPGSIEELAARLELHPAPLAGGRCGERLAKAVAITKHLVASTRQSSGELCSTGSEAEARLPHAEA